MANLIGTAFSSGTIVFTRDANPWAFRRMDDEMHSGQENRIVFDPKIAPVVVEPSHKQKAEDLIWLPRLQELLSTASVVYLQRHEELLRFRQAIHELGPNKRVVTLGTQLEVEQFAATRWCTLSHFYAHRREGFRFDIEKVVARDREQGKTFENNIELLARLLPGSTVGSTQVTFDATGVNVHNDLILWRKTVNDGETGRFHNETARIRLILSSYKQPFTFYEEYHDDFKSRWYIFDPEIVDENVRKIKSQVKRA